MGKKRVFIAIFLLLMLGFAFLVEGQFGQKALRSDSILGLKVFQRTSPKTLKLGTFEPPSCNCEKCSFTIFGY